MLIIAAAAGLIAVPAASASAAPAASSASAASSAAHHFKNCTDMHKKYKGGVARKGAKDHRSGGGHARYAPHVSTALYNANKKLDRDKDGIACEQ